MSVDIKARQALCGSVIQKEVFTVPDSEGNPIHVERDVVITWETIQVILDNLKELKQI